MHAVAPTLALVALVLILGAGMRTSDAGRSFLALQEGVELEAYRDVAGVWTIGIGHTAAAGPPYPHRGMRITTTEAYEILARDLGQYEETVLRATRGIDLEQHEFDALVSLCFNIGTHAFANSSVARYLLANKDRAAANAITWWKYSKGRIISGLVKRRRRERKLFLTGHYTGVTIRNGGTGK